jgi:putative ABC transport system ATP-binding protein
VATTDTSSGSAVIVAASAVSRRYGEGQAAVDALVDVSLEFPKGGFAAIMGPSGSGKSTLMHILAGLDRPSSGTVELDGVDLTGLDDRRLTQLRRDRVGFIFQTFNLLPVLSAEENILLPLSIAGRKPDREWLERLIDTIGVVGAVLTVTFALSGSGFVQSIPLGTLAVLLLVAALAGVIAAQLPARRAAKLDLLEALASE